jgi:hypothetical protein
MFKFILQFEFVNSSFVNSEDRMIHHSLQHQDIIDFVDFHYPALDGQTLIYLICK